MQVQTDSPLSTPEFEALVGVVRCGKDHPLIAPVGDEDRFRKLVALGLAYEVPAVLIQAKPSRRRGKGPVVILGGHVDPAFVATSAGRKRARMYLETLKVA